MKTLDTKDMIITLEELKRGLHEKWFKNEIGWFDNIIQLLQEGQKHKQMWEGFEKEYRLLWVQIKIKYNQHITLGRLMDDFKEKYFPKKEVIK